MAPKCILNNNNNNNNNNMATFHVCLGQEVVPPIVTYTCYTTQLMESPTSRHALGLSCSRSNVTVGYLFSLQVHSGSW